VTSICYLEKHRSQRTIPVGHSLIQTSSIIFSDGLWNTATEPNETEALDGETKQGAIVEIPKVCHLIF